MREARPQGAAGPRSRVTGVAPGRSHRLAGCTSIRPVPGRPPPAVRQSDSKRACPSQISTAAEACSWAGCFRRAGTNPGVAMPPAEIGGRLSRLAKAHLGPHCPVSSTLGRRSGRFASAWLRQTFGLFFQNIDEQGFATALSSPPRPPQWHRTVQGRSDAKNVRLRFHWRRLSRLCRFMPTRCCDRSAMLNVNAVSLLP